MEEIFVERKLLIQVLLERWYCQVCSYTLSFCLFPLLHRVHIRKNKQTKQKKKKKNEIPILEQRQYHRIAMVHSFEILALLMSRIKSSIWL